MDDYHIFYGSDICDETLSEKTHKYMEQLMTLDAEAYGEEKGDTCLYIGKVDGYIDRFGYVDGKLKSDYGNVDSIVAIEKDNQIIGYINFLLLSDELYQEIINPNIVEYMQHPENRDDGIKGSQVCQWSTERNNLFILSIVVGKQYRDGHIIKILTNAFLEYLREKSRTYPITSITCDTVSNHGETIMQMFRCKKILNILPPPKSDKSGQSVVVRICVGDDIRKLLLDGFYFAKRSLQ